MSHVRSTTVIPIAVYCFVVGAFSLFLAAREIYSNTAILSGTASGAAFSETAFIIIGCGLIALGAGIFCVNPLCWKILFFSLVVSVTNITSLCFVYLLSLLIDTNFLNSFYHFDRVPPPVWGFFISFYLSEIMVLCFISSDEVTSYFREGWD